MNGIDSMEFGCLLKIIEWLDFMFSCLFRHTIVEKWHLGAFDQDKLCAKGKL